MVHLGLYFAEKLRAGVALETFRQIKVVQQREMAVKHLEAAAAHWADGQLDAAAATAGSLWSAWS